MCEVLGVAPHTLWSTMRPPAHSWRVTSLTQLWRAVKASCTDPWYDEVLMRAHKVEACLGTTDFTPLPGGEVYMHHYINGMILWCERRSRRGGSTVLRWDTLGFVL